MFYKSTILTCSLLNIGLAVWEKYAEQFYQKNANEEDDSESSKSTASAAITLLSV